MVSKRLRHATSTLLVAATVMLSGCLTSIDDSCSTIAENHCANCYSCAATVDGVTGAELCDVPSADGASENGCVDFLTDLCEREARTMQDPFGDLDQCEAALDDETCDGLVEREALDRPSAPERCERFL
jgi:hypothetical protein